MKKLVVILLLAFCMMATVAFAENANVVELNWAEVKDDSVPGGFYTLNDLGLMLFVIEGLEPVETEDMYALFTNKDQTYSIAISLENAEAQLELSELAKGMAAHGATEVDYAIVNGLPCITYNMSGCDSVSFVTDGGYVISFLFGPDTDAELRQVSGYMAASIQAIQK